jgi:hypothetical protein
MKLLSTFTRSLLLAAVASFLAPIVVLGTVWLGMQLWGYLPGVGGLGLAGNHHIAGFLTVFGNGSPISGMFTIALVCALVGALFDTYAFYYNAQTQKDHYSNAIDH